GAAAAAEGTAPAVEQRQPHVVAGRPRGERLLRVVEAEGRAGRAELLGRVGVAEHDLQAASRLVQAVPDGRDLQHPVEDGRGAFEVLAGLEQGDDVQDGRLVAEGGGQLVDVGDVRGGAGERDDVAVAGAD